MKYKLVFKSLLVFFFLSSHAQALHCNKILKEKLHESTYDNIVQDLIIDHNILTHRIFIVAMLQFFAKRGVDISSLLSSDSDSRRKAKTIEYQFRHATTYFKDLKNKIKILSTKHKRDFVKEVFDYVKEAIGLKEVSVEKRLEYVPLLEEISDSDLAHIRESWILYSDEDLQNAFFTFLDEDYFSIVNKRKDVRVRKASKPGAFISENYIWGALGIGTVLTYFLWDFNPYTNWIDFFEGWIDGTIFNFTGAVLLYYQSFQTVFNIDKKRSKAYDAETRKQGAAVERWIAKKLLGLGLIKGSIYDRDKPVEYHPAIEPDGRVARIDDVDQLERLMQTFKPFPEGTPDLNAQASAKEILEFGSFLDESVSKTFNMIFESWEHFVKLSADFPVKLSEFRSLIFELSREESKRSGLNIVKLKDHARDFRYTKEAIVQIIDIFEHIVDYNQRLKKRIISYQKFLEKHKKNSLTDSQSQALQIKLDILQAHLEKVVNVENEYSKLIGLAMKISKQLALTSVLPSHIEAMVSSGFSEISVNQVTEELESLMGFLSEYNDQLELHFDYLKRFQAEDETTEKDAL